MRPIRGDVKPLVAGRERATLMADAIASDQAPGCGEMKYPSDRGVDVMVVRSKDVVVGRK